MEGTVMKVALREGEARVIHCKPFGDLPPWAVRLKPKYCGICGSDLHVYRSHKGPCSHPGHEFTARVEEVGTEVSHFLPGDRVVVEPLVGCGSCDACQKGKIIGCGKLSIIGVHQDGGLSEELIVPEYTLHKIPDTIDDVMGTLTEPLAVGVHIFQSLGYSIGKPKTEKILIIGAGTIGLLCIPVAAFFGFKTISFLGKYPFQIEMAKNLGREMGMDIKGYDINLEGLLEQPDVIIDAVGYSNSILETAIKYVKNFGKIVLVGLFSPGQSSIDPSNILFKNLTLIGSNTYDRSQSPSDFALSIQILEKYGPLLKETLITHIFSLNEVGLAFETAAHKGKMGVIKVTVKI